MNLYGKSLRAVWIIGVAFCAAAFHISASLAQSAAPITPSGLNTQVNISATPPHGTVQYDISGGTRSGTNLFHSFGNFNVPDHNIANFLNDTGLATTNILGRVTGGNVSNIFGTIQTTGFGNANLFLMNPAGIVFGPTASLNVGGSITFTTADYLRLDKAGGPNAGIFRADPTRVSLLTSASVDAFGFLGSNPGSITVEGSQFRVSEKQGISVVGGNITIQNGTLENGTVQTARLSAPNGQINLATAKSPGEFLQDLTAAPNINGMSFRSFGSVHLASGSTVDVSQTENGKVAIRGGQLVLEIQNSQLDTTSSLISTGTASIQDSIVLAPGSSLVSQTSSTDPGPNVHMIADRITILGTPGSVANLEALPFTGIRSNTQGTGNAGNIVLQATGNIEATNVVTLLSSSGINSAGTAASSTLARGNAGNVELTSMNGDILMRGGGRATQVASATFNSSGNAGKVMASAPQGDIVLDGATLITSTSGLDGGGREGGQVEITAKNLHMKAGELNNQTTGSFKPGGITVTLSGTLRMETDPSLVLPHIPSDSLIVTSSVTDAPAGDITLTAKDIVVTQGSIINSAAFASGPGGHIKVVSDTLTVTDGAQLSSGSTRAPNRGRLLEILGSISPTGAGGDITIQTLGSTNSVFIDGKGSGIFADTEGTGAGGSIHLSARTLAIQNGGTISAETSGTKSSATGGSIIINSSDQMTLTNGSSITASSKGPADAGNISINAGQQLLVQNSKITTEAHQANGGNIKVVAIDRINLANGRITTSVLEGSGDSGKIFIDPNQVVVQNNSTILTQAVHGHGGDITITTPRFLQDQTSLVDASSQFGQSGRVSIQSSTSNLSGTVAQLASKPSGAQALLQNRCVALAGGEQSTFIVAGRDTLPSEPGGWLSSALSMDHLRRHDAEHATGPTAKSVGPSGSPAMVVPVQETQALSLRRLTPPGFLVRTFGIDRLTGCRS
ncbi:MAG: hypothetical protein OJF50_000628 [Nitrospira sp.]|jgi:filamentous hemagglutinin family protein|nr:hypothetical protein [Nitrospira sp.]